MDKEIIIGTRGSKLALIYAQKVKDQLIKLANISDEQIKLKKIVTKGDQVQDKRLSEIGGKGLFSKNIEIELLEGNIDVAVHALKDMPANETENLSTYAYLKRNDPREVLITKNNKKISELNSKAIIGTSSYRREFQIKKIRNDLQSKLIRGNVDTRIQKLDEGQYDAIVLSYAGLDALSFNSRISQTFSVSEILPSAGQGIIALQCRSDDQEIKTTLNKINDHHTKLRALTERNVLKVLDGDCETAVGVHSIIEEDKITLEAELFSLDGTQRFYEKKSSNILNCEKLGIEVGKILKEKSKDSYKKK
jgi:hydroxymethylbilane synthase